MITGWWLQPTPLKNDGVRLLGLLVPTVPTEWTNNPNVPNHQPELDI
jgi:hypothetical protein